MKHQLSDNLIEEALKKHDAGIPTGEIVGPHDDQELLAMFEVIEKIENEATGIKPEMETLHALLKNISTPTKNPWSWMKIMTPIVGIAVVALFFIWHPGRTVIQNDQTAFVEPTTLAETAKAMETQFVYVEPANYGNEADISLASFTNDQSDTITLYDSTL